MRMYEYIEDVLQTIYNLSQPEWLTSNVSARMRNLTQLANEYTYGIAQPYIPELIRLRGGSMLRTLMENMKQKLYCYKKGNNGADCSWMGPLKYYAYSAHDTTVAALLTTLGDEMRVIRGGLPKYTASVAIELWDLEEGPAVRVYPFSWSFPSQVPYYYSPYQRLPGKQRILSTFEKRSIKFMPVNIKKECRRRSKNNKTVSPYHW
uniref:Lysosomal acid phosphatase n=1 Tax=Heterorhabditis bacteriophora TaxID=37862 RepID=A0A1I7XT66_HETBA